MHVDNWWVILLVGREISAGNGSVLTNGNPCLKAYGKRFVAKVRTISRSAKAKNCFCWRFAPLLNWFYNVVLRKISLAHLTTGLAVPAHD